jgi:hypothetical protein
VDSGVGEASIAFETTGTPYIAYRDNQSGKATAMRYNGTAWELIGSRGFSDGFAIFFSLRISKSNSIYMAYLDGTTSQCAVVVQKYSSGTNTWAKLPDFPVHSDGNSPFEFSVGNGDTLFLSLLTDESGSIEVYKLTGGSWIRVGGPVTTPESSGRPSLSIGEYGQLFLSYRDFLHDGRISIVSLKNNSWVPVGIPSSYPRGTYGFFDTFITVGRNGAPRVLFGDRDNADRVTVLETAFDP